MSEEGMPNHQRTLRRLLGRPAPLLLVAGVLLAGVVTVLGARGLAGEVPFDQLGSAALGMNAKLLLLGSTLLYVAHLWWAGRALGRWASGLALVGALGLLGSVLLGGSESGASGGGGHVALTSLREVMALFSAFTVLIYLVMERAYRSHSAGAFVMPLVAAAVLLEGWLSASQQPAVLGPALILRSYEVRAHVTSDFIGFGAFAVAAALGVMVLLRERAQRAGAGAGFALRVLPSLARTEQLMHLVIGFGFPLFTIGIALGMHIAHTVSGRFWTGSAKEIWALLVWCAYAGYFFLHYALRWRGVRMAWWLLAGFCLSAVGFLFMQLCVFGKLSYV